MKVLIVDDNATFVEQLKKYLSLKNFEVEGVAGGKKAMELLGKEKYDVVLVDLKMPDVHGMEIVKWAKEEGISSRFIIITGYGEVESAVEAMKMGVVDYIQKPFPPEKLVELIKGMKERKEDFNEDEDNLLLITFVPPKKIKEKYSIRASKTIFVEENIPLKEILHAGRKFMEEDGKVMIFDVGEFMNRYGREDVAKFFRMLSSCHSGSIKVIYNSIKDILLLEESMGNIILPVLERMITAYNHPIRREIIHLLDIYQPLSYSEIMKKIGLKQSSKLAFHLKKLISLGAVEKMGSNYMLSENGKRIVEVLEMLAGMERRGEINYIHVNSI